MPLITPLPRRRIAEVMDDPALDADAHALALAGLARINRVSETAAQVYQAVRRLRGDRPTRALDLACGGGDVTMELARLAEENGDPYTFDGADVSERAVRMCEASARRLGVACRFHVVDAVRDPLPRGYDLALSTLFFHHLSAEEVSTVLRKMGLACEAVVVSDLKRSRWALVMTHVAVRVLSRSPVVHVDGPRSAWAGWRREELVELAERAGLSGAQVRAAFPSRWMVTWSRESGGDGSEGGG